MPSAVAARYDLTKKEKLQRHTGEKDFLYIS
jgi:hypothetical protein